LRTEVYVSQLFPKEQELLRRHLMAKQGGLHASSLKPSFPMVKTQDSLSRRYVSFLFFTDRMSDRWRGLRARKRSAEQSRLDLSALKISRVQLTGASRVSTNTQSIAQVFYISSSRPLHQEPGYQIYCFSVCPFVPAPDVT